MPRSLKAAFRSCTSSPALIFGSCACLLLLGWACFNWFSMLQRDIRDFAPIPELDYWLTVAHIPRYEAFDATVLWEQLYEQRIVFAEIVFAVDYLGFHGRQILPAVLNVLCQAMALMLFALALRRTRGVPGHFTFAAVCLQAVLLAYPGVTYCLSLPLLLHFFILQLAVLSSLLLLARGKLLGTIAGGVVAAFSLASGLALWPILIFFAWLRQESVRRICILAAAFVFATAAFFAGYRNLGNFRPARAFSRPPYLAGYFLRYVSMPFGAVNPYAGVIVGSCAVLAVVALFATGWRKRLLTEPAATAGFGVCFLVLFTAAMTSMSRIPFYRSWQESSTIPGHYLNLCLHFWAALVMLAVFVLCRTFRSPVPPAMFLSIFALGAVIQQTQMGPWMHYWLKTPAMYRFASLILESGVKSELAYGILHYSDPQLVPRSLPVLADRRLSVYSYPQHYWIGRFAPSLFNLSSAARESAQITSVSPIPSGFLTAGWASGTSSEVVLLDRDRMVVGLGERFTSEWPDLAPIAAGHTSQGWIAFSQTPPTEACLLSGDRFSAVCFVR
jgi:hypothetical protein